MENLFEACFYGKGQILYHVCELCLFVSSSHTPFCGGMVFSQNKSKKYNNNNVIIITYNNNTLFSYDQTSQK